MNQIKIFNNIIEDKNIFIICTAFITYILHKLTYYSSSNINRRSMQYFLSFLHSLISSSLYILYFNNKNHFNILELNDFFIIGIHIGYYLSDGIIEYNNNNWNFVIHHIFSIYFIGLNLYLNTINNFGKGMLVAEFTGFLVNFRVLFIKFYKQKNLYMDIIFFIIYFVLRCIYTPYILYDYINYSNNYDMQIVFSVFFFWFISTIWSYSFGKSIIKTIKRRKRYLTL